MLSRALVGDNPNRVGVREQMRDQIQASPYLPPSLLIHSRLSIYTPVYALLSFGIHELIILVWCEVPLSQKTIHRLIGFVAKDFFAGTVSMPH